MNLLSAHLRRWLIGLSHRTAKKKSRTPNLAGSLLGERRKGRKQQKRFPYPSATAAIKRFAKNLEVRRQAGEVLYGQAEVDTTVVRINRK